MTCLYSLADHIDHEGRALPDTAWSSGRIIAHSDRAAFLGDYFRIGGYLAETGNFRPERLDES
jgi:hypothetical protein